MLTISRISKSSASSATVALTLLKISISMLVVTALITQDVGFGVAARRRDNSSHSDRSWFEIDPIECSLFCIESFIRKGNYDSDANCCGLVSKCSTRTRCGLMRFCPEFEDDCQKFTDCEEAEPVTRKPRKTTRRPRRTTREPVDPEDTTTQNPEDDYSDDEDKRHK